MRGRTLQIRIGTASTLGAPRGRAGVDQSLNVAVAAAPLTTVTLITMALRDRPHPVRGAQVTEYVPGLTVSRSVDMVPFAMPLTEKAQLPPVATATRVPSSPGPAAGTALAEGALVALAVAGGAALAVADAALTVALTLGAAEAEAALEPTSAPRPTGSCAGRTL